MKNRLAVHSQPRLPHIQRICSRWLVLPLIAIGFSNFANASTFDGKLNITEKVLTAADSSPEESPVTTLFLGIDAYGLPTFNGTPDAT